MILRRKVIPSLLLWATFASVPGDLVGQGRDLANGLQDPWKSEALAPTRVPRPGVGGFARDLAKNAVGVFSGDNLLPFLLGTGATAAAHPADVTVRNYFDGGDRFGVFEKGLGEQLGRLPVVFGTVGGLWALGRFYGNDGFAQFSYDLAQASALTGIATFAVKSATGRIRPNGSSDLSLPSGHTSAAFAAATVVDQHYGTTASIAAYATAAFVAASRLDAGKHYLSDVVAGATLGYIVGRTVSRRRVRSNGIAWTPILSPSTQSLGVRLSWQFGSQPPPPTPIQ